MRFPLFLLLVALPCFLFGNPPAKDSPPGAKTPVKKNASPEKVPEGMVWIPGGTYSRGEDRDIPGARSKYPEETPVHKVTVDGFWMDATEVTNAQFLKFTKATGYKTQAELGWSKKDFPQAPPEQLRAGAMCFVPPAEQVENLFQPGAEWNWWKFIPGASWRNPQGPGSSIKDKMNHPVVCITHQDAAAYCKWAGKRLPTEAEWERAARGGLKRKLFMWGDTAMLKGKWQANVFQGEFPHLDTALDGFRSTAPVKTFPPNGYGLYDMAGNVWEHCSDLYRPEFFRTFAEREKPEKNPKGPSSPVSQPMVQMFRQAGRYPPGQKPFHPLAWLWVTKGGSYLCHAQYCLRYRPAARHYSESLSPTNHTGFRCVKSKSK